MRLSNPNQTASAELKERQRFDQTPAVPSAWGHLTERADKALQRPDSITEPFPMLRFFRRPQ